MGEEDFVARVLLLSFFPSLQHPQHSPGSRWPLLFPFSAVDSEREPPDVSKVIYTLHKGAALIFRF